MSQVPPYNNPYATPLGGGQKPGSPANSGKITAPGIALVITGGLGMIMTLFSIVWAFVGPEPPFNPDMPEFFREIQQGGRGPLAAAVQVIFIFVNAVIIAGGVAMIRQSMWGLALAASIVAMVNIGNCCCLIGLPIGIWSLVILLMADVKAAFAQNR